MRDFEAYYAAGRAVNGGGNPYSPSLLASERHVPGVASGRAELLPYVGAPPTAALWSLLARLDYLQASRVWMLALLAALAALVAATVSCCGEQSPEDALTASLCALSFVPITSAFVLGQPALAAYAGTAVALVANRRSISLTVLAFMTGALHPNVALPGLATARARRGLAALGLAAAGLYVLGAFASGPAWPALYAHVVGEHAQAERVLAIQYTPAAILFGLGFTETAATYTGTAIAIAAVVVAAAGAARVREDVRRFAILCAALPLCTGFVHEHDFVVIFIAALWATRALGPRAGAAAIFAYGLCAVNWLDFAQQPGAALQDVVLAAAALAAILAWRRKRGALDYAAASLTFAAVLFGAAVGAQHHAPIWPNDMRAFTVPHGANAAYFWHAEQIASGLERVEPAWSLLRSFPVAGSIVLLAICVFAKPSSDIDVHEIVERRNRIGVEVL